MAHHKIAHPIVEVLIEKPIEFGRFDKFKGFVTHPDTVKYMGRTVMVISLAIAAYVIYKHKSKIHASCKKAAQTVKNCFKGKESDGTLLLPNHVKEVNIHVLHDAKVTIYKNPKEPGTPGAEGESKCAKELIPESSSAT